MNNFKVGDTVEVLDDTVSGIVTAVAKDAITVETDAGFMLDYASNELVKISNYFTVTNHDVAQIKKEKESPKPRNTNTFKPKERNLPKNGGRFTHSSTNKNI